MLEESFIILLEDFTRVSGALSGGNLTFQGALLIIFNRFKCTKDVCFVCSFFKQFEKNLN
jgi:hypothetical protein